MNDSHAKTCSDVYHEIDIESMSRNDNKLSNEEDRTSSEVHISQIHDVLIDSRSKSNNNYFQNHRFREIVLQHKGATIDRCRYHDLAKQEVPVNRYDQMSTRPECHQIERNEDIPDLFPQIPSSSDMQFDFTCEQNHFSDMNRGDSEFNVDAYRETKARTNQLSRIGFVYDDEDCSPSSCHAFSKEHANLDGSQNDINHLNERQSTDPTDNQLISEAHIDLISDQHCAVAKIVVSYPPKEVGSLQKSRRSKCQPKKVNTRICQCRKSSAEVVPTINDVLLGRGGKSNNHLGNRRYRQARDDIQPRYMAAIKKMKTGICRELVNQVYSWNGRFLQKHERGHWYVATDKKAMAKSSQVLRETK
jgi:hypothetical protein